MRNRNYMEIIGVLSLSLLITSPMTVSGTLPEMLEAFSEYPRAMVENLFSIPALPILVIISLTPKLLTKIKEKTMIIAGLFIIGAAGITPLFVSSFPLIFASRICLGIGIGLVNTLAVSMIGERFTGELRQKLQGIRCSMETLGEASLIFIAGQLLIFGWHYPYLVYGLSFVVLAIYICFVPDQSSSRQSEVKVEEKAKHKISATSWRLIIQNALLGGLLVSTLTANALRMAAFVVDSDLGTATQGSTILSVSIFAGFVGGLFFGYLLQKFQGMLLPASMVLVALAMVGIVLSNNLIVIALTASITGLFLTIVLSYMFNSLSDQFPVEDLNTANAIVLVGCNLGSFVTPFFLHLVGLVNSSLAAGFIAYAAIYLLLGAVTFVKQLKR